MMIQEILFLYSPDTATNVRVLVVLCLQRERVLQQYSLTVGHSLQKAYTIKLQQYIYI